MDALPIKLVSPGNWDLNSLSFCTLQFFYILGKKKRSKDNFKSGGTWPRARGGPIIEQGTGMPSSQIEKFPLHICLNF